MRLTTACAAAALALLVPAASRPGSPEKPADGLVLAVGGGHLKVAFCAEDVVRVAFARDPAFFDRPSLAAGVRRCEPVPVGRADAAGHATLSTSKLKVRVDLGTGDVAFLDAAGEPILVERKGGRTLVAAEVQGEKTYHVRQEWRENADEALYGLGENQLGLLDIKGYDLDLWQHNGTVVVPVPGLEPRLRHPVGQHLLHALRRSARVGADSRRAPLRRDRQAAAASPARTTRGANFEHLVGERVDRDHRHRAFEQGEEAEPAHPPGLPEGPASVRWEGEVEAEATGDHIFQTFSNGGIKLWVDDTLVIDHWRQGWLPWKDVAQGAARPSAATR